jgi:hypothetical protein
MPAAVGDLPHSLLLGDWVPCAHGSPPGMGEYLVTSCTSRRLVGLGQPEGRWSDCCTLGVPTPLTRAAGGSGEVALSVAATSHAGLDTQPGQLPIYESHTLSGSHANGSSCVHHEARLCRILSTTTLQGEGGALRRAATWAGRLGPPLWSSDQSLWHPHGVNNLLPRPR